MSSIFGPILPIQLDGRNTEDLVRAIQSRVNLESGGVLNDFTEASPLAAVSEGQAFAQSELLYYLNTLPEAFSIQWLRQLGVQRKIGSRAFVDITFTKQIDYRRAVTIPPSTRLVTASGLVFTTLNELVIDTSDFSGTVTAQSERWGSVYNVEAGTIAQTERAFTGIESVVNEEAAAGGSDLETIDEMKLRAFQVLSRRNLTTKVDFETEIRDLAPEGSILKVLTYEERNRLDSIASGSVAICVGDEDGRALSQATSAQIINMVKNRVSLGTNMYLVTPDIVPVDLVVGVIYDPQEIVAGSDFYANEIFVLLRDFFSNLAKSLGSALSYQDVSRELYALDFVKSINSLDIRVMVRSSDVLDGLCAGFSGEEDPDNQKCLYSFSSVVSPPSETGGSVETLEAPSPISSFKLYNAEISLISKNDFSALTYSYTNLYRP